MKKILTQKRPLGLIVLLVLVILAGFTVYNRYFSAKDTGPPEVKPQAVRAAEAALGAMDVYIQALGTVTPPNTVTVRSRVDGQLMALYFEEGQTVREGQRLAQIDPRPFEVQRNQAQGTLAKNQALLQDARLDLERYKKLIKERSVSAQQLQAQEALVGQYEGQVLSDEATVADAELQLTYSLITAPISGRIGLRKVDVGNMVRASDSEGLLIITQMRPMHVVFTLVEKDIPQVLRAMRALRKADPDGDERIKNGLPVEAWGQDMQSLLATGYLLTIDNQIDTSTGTVKAKAVFDNVDEILFPNQFVNARLKVQELKDVLLIPTSAVQRNNDGFFVYVIEDGKTRMKTITTGYSTDRQTVVATGLEPGEVAVTDGVDRLREGTRVTFDTDSSDEQEIPSAVEEDASAS